MMTRSARSRPCAPSLFMRYNTTLASRGGAAVAEPPPAPVGRVTPCAPPTVAVNQTTGTIPVAATPPSPARSGGLKKIAFAKPAKKEESKKEEAKKEEVKKAEK